MQHTGGPGRLGEWQELVRVRDMQESCAEDSCIFGCNCGALSTVRLSERGSVNTCHQVRRVAYIPASDGTRLPRAPGIPLGEPRSAEAFGP